MITIADYRRHIELTSSHRRFILLLTKEQWNLENCYKSRPSSVVPIRCIMYFPNTYISKACTSVLIVFNYIIHGTVFSIKIYAPSSHWWHTEHTHTHTHECILTHIYLMFSESCDKNKWLRKGAKLLVMDLNVINIFILNGRLGLCLNRQVQFELCR